MEFSGVFWKIYDACKGHPRYISNVGGTRSTKTYSTLQFLHLLIQQADKTGDVTSVVSETMPHLRKGCIRDFEDIIGHPLKSDPKWNASNFVYTYDNGAILEFFSSDTPQKVHGSQRKRLYTNEANHIPWEIFRQLDIRTSGLVFIDYNPSSECWIQKNIEIKPNCVTIHSTYKDNPFLTEMQIRAIEDNKNDARWWKVYGLGEVGTLDGLVYDFDLVDSLPPKDADKDESLKTDEELYADSLIEVWGLDFGFTNDPTAIVKILADPKRKEAWIQEKCYQTHMLNADIARHLKLNGLDRHTEIYADCAEKKSIAEIAQAGVRMLECTKNAPVKSEKRLFQIQYIQGWKLHFTKDSLNLIYEGRNYTWQKNADGVFLNIPVATNDHLMDAMRYALYTRFGQEANKGKYRIICR